MEPPRRRKQRDALILPFRQRHDREEIAADRCDTLEELQARLEREGIGVTKSAALGAALAARWRQEHHPLASAHNRQAGADERLVMRSSEV